MPGRIVRLRQLWRWGEHTPTPVGNTIGNAIQSLIGKRNTNIFRLSAIDTASQCPSTIGVGTVIHITVPAEETLSAKGLHIDCHPVTRLHISDFRAGFFNHTHHFVGSINTGFGFSTKANFPFSMYVYAIINLNKTLIIQRGCFPLKMNTQLDIPIR